MSNPSKVHEGAQPGTGTPAGNRPLSPHLQVYRWQITMTMSILHRASGLALSVGSLVLAWWLNAVAVGGAHYAWVTGILGSPAGLAFLAGWSVAFFYHLGNGIRHLLWDAGRGFEIGSMYRTGWAVVVFVMVATAFTWWCAWWSIGGQGGAGA